MSENPNIAPVELSESNPEWVEKFAVAKSELEKVIGGHVVSIEHIGSTAIPNLPAKPEIDILVGVEKLEDINALIEPLKAIGYPYYKRFEEFVPNRRYFRKSEGIVPLVHVHAYEVGSKEYADHIVFRDYMKSHHEAVKEYGDLKKNLLETSSGDRGVYQDGKKVFITQILQKAHKEDLWTDYK